MRKYKDFILLNDQHEYVQTIRSFESPKNPGKYSKPLGTLEIPEPDMRKVEHCRVFWNFQEKKWKYISYNEFEKIIDVDAQQKKENANESGYEVPDQVAQKEKEQHLPNPLVIFRIIRDRLLKESDVYVMQCYEDDVKVPDKVKEYRKELRNLPEKISDGTIPAPTLRELPETYHPMNLLETINFDHWPLLPKELEK